MSHGQGRKGVDLHADGIEVFAQSLPAVLCIVGQHVDLHLGQPLSIPRSTHTYGPVITVVWAFPWILLDVGFPGMRCIIVGLMDQQAQGRVSKSVDVSGKSEPSMSACVPMSTEP